MSLAGRVALVAIPLLVLASIWIPPLAHYLVLLPAPSDMVIERSRSIPPRGLLQEIGEAKHTLIPPLGRLIEKPADEADALLIPAPGAESGYPFDPRRLGDLEYASMSVPRTLLKAYAVTADERYFDAAREFLADWAAFEAGAWLPHGLLWNDHAVAARAWTYTEFWRLFRQHPGYNVEEARQFLRQVTTAAARLADPAHYTYASNHGTMQNLALMHLGLAFPELEGFDELPDLGLSRQREQFGYMMSAGGMVLEHSAGYHRLGTELLAVMLRYRTLQQAPIPESLLAAYGLARSVYRQLRAPDGTLPPLGDSSIALLGPEVLTTEIDGAGRATPLRRDADWGDPDPVSWYPDAGYAIWWSPAGKAQGNSQTTITWARFPRHGHKHADELSFNLRSGDMHWWRSSGYWPLGHEQRSAATSWAGSNAPHLAGELYDSLRQSLLLGYVAGQGIRILDLRRDGPDSFSVRRQIVHVEPDLWLILDAYPKAADGPLRTLWTTSHDISITRAQGEEGFALQAAGSATALRTWFLGEPEVSPRRVRGQADPFAGWVESLYSPEPSDALLIDMPSQQRWVANVSLLSDLPATSFAAPLARRWQGSESWHFEVPIGDDTLSISREGRQIRVLRRGEETSVSLQPVAAGNPSAWQKKSLENYHRAASGYGPVFNARIPYRTKMTRWLSVLFMLQIVGFYLVARHTAMPLAPIGALVSLGWFAVAAWLHLVYFAT